MGVRDFVNGIEQVIIDTLAEYQIDAQRRNKAPGVYVNDAKIAALGLRVRRGYSFHGMSLNVDMDLQPFTWINPCGYEGLAVTQMRDLLSNDFLMRTTTPILDHVGTTLCRHFSNQFGFQITESEAS